MGKVLTVILAGLLTGCGGLGALRNPDEDDATLVRQSPGADQVLALQSDRPCRFLVDGKQLASGKKARVKVTLKRHQVICQPDGYRAKAEYLEPPYGVGGAFAAFVFGDEDKQDDSASASSSKAAPPSGSDVDAPGYRVAADGRKVALVIGAAGRYSERDARAVREHLAALGFPAKNVRLLAGADATPAAMTAALDDWLPSRAGGRSTVVVYYSGPRLTDAGLPPPRLLSRVAALKAADAVVLLDAPGEALPPPPAKGLLALSAARDGQAAGDDDDQRHGLFTYFLLRGLGGAAKDEDGAVTARSLFDYLAPQVRDAAKARGREQRAVLSAGADAADIRLR